MPRVSSPYDKLLKSMSYVTGPYKTSSTEREQLSASTEEMHNSSEAGLGTKVWKVFQRLFVLVTSCLLLL